MYFDITILVLVCVTALIGFAKGMLSQVISLAAFAGSIIVTGMAQGRVSSWLQGVVAARFPDIQVDPRMTQFAAAVLLFCALYFAMGSVLEFVKRKTVVALSLQISDRFLGLFIGIGKGLAASLLIIAAVQ